MWTCLFEPSHLFKSAGCLLVTTQVCYWESQIILLVSQTLYHVTSDWMTAVKYIQSELIKDSESKLKKHKTKNKQDDGTHNFPSFFLFSPATAGGWLR